MTVDELRLCAEKYENYLKVKKFYDEMISWLPTSKCIAVVLREDNRTQTTMDVTEEEWKKLLVSLIEIVQNRQVAALFTRKKEEG